jgi:hypothetical protein
LSERAVTCAGSTDSGSVSRRVRKARANAAGALSSRAPGKKSRKTGLLPGPGHPA